jgi:hypothetical protein
MTDPHFDRALRAAARRGRPAGPCLDAALLAAYVDRSVSDEERARIDAHVADCSTCMEHLALLAAVDAPDQPAEGGSGFSVGQLLPRWGWLVPLATVALVVAIWVREPNSTPAPPASLATPERAAAPASSVATTNAPVTSADEGRFGARNPTEEVTKQAAGSRRQAAGSGQPAADSRQQPAGGGQQAALSALEKAKADKPAGLKLAAGGAAGSLRERDKKIEDKASNENAVLGGAPMASPAPATPVPPAAGAAVDALREPRSEEAAQMQRPAQAATAAKVERHAYARVDALMKDADLSPLVVAVGPTVRVRAIDGRVERSTNGGATWLTEHTLGSDHVRAGTCPSEAICWLGGDGGVVLIRSAAGAWTREVVIPDPGAVVVAIAASDAASATVTLRDQRRFKTTDGGHSWISVPLESPRQ